MKISLNAFCSSFHLTKMRTQKKKKTDCKIIRNLRHSLSVSLSLSIPLSLSAAHAAKHELVNTTGRKNHIFHTRTQLTHTHHEVFVVSNLQQFSPHLPTTTTTTTARETTVKKGEKKILSRKKMKRKQENLPQFLSPLARSFPPSQRCKFLQFCTQHSARGEHKNKY